jgi:nanoRNase/pAp phosphatase (c-di-AMP/oligoRNAs hydrolase)
VDVQAVAAMFGGGGHKAASGCTMPSPLASAKARLIPLLEHAVNG